MMEEGRRHHLLLLSSAAAAAVGVIVGGCAVAGKRVPQYLDNRGTDPSPNFIATHKMCIVPIPRTFFKTFIWTTEGLFPKFHNPHLLTLGHSGRYPHPLRSIGLCHVMLAATLCLQVVTSHSRPML